MDLITLQSGTIIDIDSVACVAAILGSGAPAPHGVRIILAGQQESLFGDDARGFLTALENSKKTDVKKLLESIPPSRWEK